MQSANKRRAGRCLVRLMVFELIEASGGAQLTDRRICSVDCGDVRPFCYQHYEAKFAPALRERPGAVGVRRIQLAPVSRAGRRRGGGGWRTAGSFWAEVEPVVESGAAARR